MDVSEKFALALAQMELSDWERLRLAASRAYESATNDDMRGHASRIHRMCDGVIGAWEDFGGSSADQISPLIRGVLEDAWGGRDQPPDLP